jgi:signal transduction histidine kinase
MTPIAHSTNDPQRRIEHLERSQRAMQALLEKVETLARFQERIDHPTDPVRIWEACRLEIEQLVPAGTTGLCLVDDATREFQLRVVQPEDDRRLCQREIDAQIACGMFAWIVNRRQPALVPALALRRPGALLMLPLATQRHTLGAALVVTSLEHSAVTQETLRLLAVLTRQCALVMENARLYEALKREHASLDRAQICVRQSEKLAAIGRLTARVFHELLNPLNILSGHLQLLQMAPESSAAPHLPVMKAQSDRIAGIVRGLLRFSDTQPVATRAVALPPLLEALLARRLAAPAPAIALEADLPADLPAVRGNPEALEQVFGSLIDNAVEAMPGGGTLRVAAGPAPLPEESCRADGVAVSVADEGPGIPAPHLHQIFDPFFSTKSGSHGRGLNLATSFALTRALGGTLTAANGDGGGAVFTVYLPVTVEGPEMPAGSPMPHEPRGEPTSGI